MIIDAPDLPVAGSDQTSTTSGSDRANGASLAPAAPARTKRGSRPDLPVHDPAQLAASRNELEGELGRLTTTAEMTAWASRVLPIKASLALDDAEALEANFGKRMEAINKRMEAINGLPRRRMRLAAPFRQQSPSPCRPTSVPRASLERPPS